MPKTVFSGAHTHLVELLVSARKKSGLTQTDLAEKVGKSQRFISLIERGQRRVDVLEFAVLAKAMGLDPVKLYAELTKRLPAKFDI
ncbi:MAG: XRE family transcriptional regulator [Verrucomicrobiaceae bacterium]|nr:MAG: XRE family transcriptional regulator [Verrucomicrobiaceae bacterium]